MTEKERQQVLEQLAASQKKLVEAVRPLTPAQWRFRESPGRWSAEEIVEHLLLFEGFIRGVVARTLAQPAEPEKQTQAPGKEPLVLGLANSRDRRIDAREVVRPTGRAWERDELLARLDAARAETLAFASTTEAPLHEHFFAHLAFGDLDCRQWLLVLSQHTARHVLQIEEIQRAAGYPEE
ncbi:DinB superfamily protein [Granulicella rosea]|uniref:DinB superfamily protein n=1 Tax=Granulicella rosea TaxID=474952 RepID=A0A239LIM6_9BACT|nr:DinB family protein [Granulicella rosea]SNT30311.1 DinB superfamily protein [Granulicella rosea]